MKIRLPSSQKKNNHSMRIKKIKKKRRKRAQELRTKCAAAASAIAKVKRISHTHAAVASQLSAV
jgi:hypothetical protein